VEADSVSDFQPGEVVLITQVDPSATVIRKQAFRCHSCGGAVFHCALIETGEHVDLCISMIKRRAN
jgi:hypothetical protein